MSASVTLWNNFEGGTDGVTLTNGSTGNTGHDSGNFADGVVGAPAFSSAHPAHGALGMVSTIGGAVTTGYFSWVTAMNAVTTLYGRFYIYMTASSPVAALGLCSADQAGSTKWRITLNASNQVCSRDTVNNVNRSTSAMALSTNTLYRIEYQLVCSVTAQVTTIRIYAGDSTTALEEDVSASWAGVSNLDGARFGLQSGTASLSAWYDAIAVTDGGWIGPANTQGRNLVHRIVGGLTPTTAKVGVKAIGGTASVRVKYSTTSDLATSPGFSSAVPPDGNGMATLSLSGLTPNTQYYYGVELDGEIESFKNGQFKTFPEYGAKSYSFAFASCAASGTNPDTFDTMRSMNPLFFHHLGDLHYENITANDQAAYRTAWGLVLQSSRQAAMFANVPLAYSWSDHDSGDNNHDGSELSLIAAAAVYRQYMPGYPLPAADNQGIYHTYVVGRIRFIVTDTRSYRSADSATDDASKTMLGAAQKLWFKQQLLQPEPVKIWCLEMPWTGATTAGDDGYSGFNTERQELASFITQNMINILIINGDTHCLAADDGTNSAGNIPVCVGAPLSQSSNVHGAPYSQGYYPNPVGPSAHGFGLMNVTDNGTTISLAYTGYDDTATSRITLNKTFTPRTVEAWGMTV